MHELDPIIHLHEVDLYRVRSRRLIQRWQNLVLSGVNMEIMPGEAVAIWGRSGSGKTTLLHSLVGLVPVRRGTMHVAGHEVLNLSFAELRQLRREVQLVLQDAASSLCPRFTVSQALLEPLEIHRLLPDGAEKRAAIVYEMLEKVGLPGSLSELPVQFLSGGQKQRVSVARALVLEPQILLLDEPSTGLDLSLRGAFLTMLRELRQERSFTLLVASHDRWELQALCTRAYRIEDKRLLQDNALLR